MRVGYTVSMATLVIDIETIGEDFMVMDETTQHVLTNYIRETSATDEEYEVKLAELRDQLGFSPMTGSICAIGVWDWERKGGVVYYVDPTGKEKDSENEDGTVRFRPMSERDMLKHFWDGAERYQDFVTFNGRAFDIPFLIIRSAINGIRPSKDLMSNRYLSLQKFGAKHIDLFDQLSFYGSSRFKGSGLHMWCRAFGITSPKADGVDGNAVAQLFKEGRGLDIARYNVGDIVATKDLYEKWLEYFAPTPKSEPTMRWKD